MTPVDDVTCDDVIVAAAPADAFIRTFDVTPAAEADAAALPVDADGGLCCVAVDAATTDDVMTCCGDVTDWLGAVAAIGGDDVDTKPDDVTSFGKDGGSLLLEDGPACAVEAPTGAVCLCEEAVGVDVVGGAG